MNAQQQLANILSLQARLVASVQKHGKLSKADTLRFRMMRAGWVSDHGPAIAELIEVVGEYRVAKEAYNHNSELSAIRIDRSETAMYAALRKLTQDA